MNQWRQSLDKPTLFGPYDRENPQNDATYGYMQDIIAYWIHAKETDNFEAMSKYLEQNTSEEACLLFDHIFTEYEFPISLEEATFRGGLTRN